MDKFVVIMYHKLLSSGEGTRINHDKYAVSDRTFKRHLETIAGKYKAVPLEGLASGPVEKDYLGHVGITFDDGNASDYEIAYPLLEERRIPATFFINTANIGKEGYLDWSRIRKMSRCGMAIGSHGHEHIRLTSMDRQKVKHQLSVSKRIIEDKVGAEAKSISSPYGAWNPDIAQAAFDAGYGLFCTSGNRPNRFGDTILHRCAIYGNTSDRTLSGLIETRNSIFLWRAFRGALISIPKTILRK